MVAVLATLPQVLVRGQERPEQGVQAGGAEGGAEEDGALPGQQGGESAGGTVHGGSSRRRGQGADGVKETEKADLSVTKVAA